MELFKLSISALVIATGLFVTGSACAASKPVVGIAEFKKSVAVNWWGGQVGWDMADMLSNELMGTKKFNVVERQKLNAVIAEQDLAASGRVRKGTGAKTGQRGLRIYSSDGWFFRPRRGTGCLGAGLGLRQDAGTIRISAGGKAGVPAETHCGELDRPGRRPSPHGAGGPSD